MAEIVDSMAENGGKLLESLIREEDIFGTGRRSHKGREKNGGNIVCTYFYIPYCWVS